MFIGNLIPVKGVHYLIQAFSRLVKEHGRDDAVLFLVGEGGERETLSALAGQLDMGKKIFFCGQKSHEEIPLWLNMAHMLVLPSVSEGFPTIIPEAMMCGVPVVASDVGGVSEIISGGSTGILTQPGDIGQICAAMRLLLEDPGLRLRISEAARAASERFTWEANALKSVEVYRKLERLQTTDPGIRKDEVKGNPT